MPTNQPSPGSRPDFSNVSTTGARPDFSNVRGGASSTAGASHEEERRYTVQKGDSLSKIARREYGDAKHWHRIFEANRDVIDDPDLIQPGQSLRIP